MRLHGYCNVCRRIKLVSVSGHSLALAHARRGVIQGICAECEQSQRKEKKHV
jgi:hypothetical protein